MTDKVQKIHEKVVEIINSINPFIPDEGGKNSNYEAGKLDAATQILQIIDSLQEESKPKFKVGQTITDPTDPTFTFHINKIEDGRYIEKEDEWVLVKEADVNYELVEEPLRRTKSDIDAAMAEVEEKSKAFAEAHKGESADNILAEMRGEEPVSKVWHDSNKEQPNFASAVAIWYPKYKNGEIISRCTEVYSDRIWAYIDDLLKM